MYCIHLWPNKLRMGWLCCPGIVWEPITEPSSNTTCQGMLIHGHLSLLCHCGQILAKEKTPHCWKLLPHLAYLSTLQNIGTPFCLSISVKVKCVKIFTQRVMSFNGHAVHLDYFRIVLFFCFFWFVLFICLMNLSDVQLSWWWWQRLTVGKSMWQSYF